MSEHPSQPLRVVIVGGGTAGWMSAAGLRRQLAAADYSVTLIESDEIGTVGVGEATLPHIKVFNDLLGIDEAQFMRATRATFKLGIQFCAWGQPGDRYLHPFGAFGAPWGGAAPPPPRPRAGPPGGPRGPLQDYSFAAVAARRNVFEFPTKDRNSIRSTYAYAYHFDAGLYASFLRTWAMERGVHRIEGQVCDVSRFFLTGDVVELTLQSGERVAGDLFVDCSGFRSLLLARTLGVGWRDWAQWLPCDRALAVPRNRVGPLTPYTRSTACQAGWKWRIPLQHRTGNGYVFSSRFIEESDAQVALLGGLEAPAQAEPRLLRFAPGRRDQAWSGNCVAIGLASGFLEPLESTSIFLVQAAVLDLVNLMPRGRAAPIEPRLANEFNRLSEQQYERVRDFLVLHYIAIRRFGEPFWDYLRSMPLPDTLEHKLELFRSRAAVPNYQYGLFARDSWLAVLVGQGIIPRGYDRLADRFPLSTVTARLNDLRSGIRTGVAAMTSHAEFVAGYCGSNRDEAAA